VLRDCGALARLLPEVDRLWGSAPPSAADVLLRALDISAQLGCELPQRFACLGYAVGPDLAVLGGLCRRLRVPLECRELAELTAREQQLVESSEALGAAALLGLLERCDALRRPERFEAMLVACECIVRSTTALQDEPFPQRAHLQGVLHAALEVDTAGVAARAAQLGLIGPAVGQAIHEARHQAVAAKLLPAAHRD